MLLHLHKALGEALDGVHQINNVGGGAFLHVRFPHNARLFVQKQTLARGIFALSPLICDANL